MAETSTKSRSQSKDLVKVGPRYFQIRGQLGKGGFSVVYAGADSDTGKKVALKMMFDVTADQEDATYKQTCDEIKMMRKLQHKNLIKLLGYDLHASYLNRQCVILVQEIAPNRELFEYLLHSQSTFSTSLVVYVMKNVFNAIAFMHGKGVAHRDLKPENILLDKEFTVKIADFGFAKYFFKHDQRMKMRTELGTRGYMAPEISENAKAASRANRKSYDEKIDTFALGVILFICTSGFPPFRQTTHEDWWFDKIMKKQWNFFWKAHERKHKFSPQVKSLLEHMLAKDPSSRYTVEECLAHEFMTQSKPQMQKNEYIQEMKQRYGIVKQKLRSINNSKGATNRDYLMPVQDMDRKILETESFLPAELLCMNDIRRDIFEAPAPETEEDKKTLAKLIATNIVNVNYPKASPQDIFAITKSVTEAYQAMSATDLASLKNSLCNADSKESLADLLPEDFDAETLFLAMNRNLLTEKSEIEVSMNSIAQYKEFDNTNLYLIDPAVLQESADGEFGSLVHHVKYGFGTFVHFMKDLHAKTPSVSIDVSSGSATVTYQIEETMNLEGEDISVTDSVEILLQMHAFDTSENADIKGFAITARPNGFLQTHLNAFNICWEKLLHESNFLHPLFVY